MQFPLDGDGRYAVRGVIDRLVRARDGALEIHDYKTGRRLPSQDELDRDRQLALYEIGVRAACTRKARCASSGTTCSRTRCASRGARPSSSMRSARSRAARSTGSGPRRPGTRARASSARGASTARSARRSAGRTRGGARRRRARRGRVEPALALLSRASVAEMALRIERIPTLSDNYTYLLLCEETGDAAVVDAPEAEPVIKRAEVSAPRSRRCSRRTTTPITRWRTPSSRSAGARRSTATRRTAVASPASRSRSRKATRSRSAGTTRASSSSPPTRSATSRTCSTRARGVLRRHAVRAPAAAACSRARPR